MPDAARPTPIDRRRFLACGARGAAGLAVAGLAGWSAARAKADDTVWQIDPLKCIQCGNCATRCVLTPSAVKCVHAFPVCGHCRLCFGYFQPGATVLHEGAENQLCPTGALRRKFIEEPYYQYSVDEPLCIGCGKCVKGCNTFGNGSLHLQICHDRCVNCNECSIARSCPADAFVRLPASKPYLLKGPPAAA